MVERSNLLPKLDVKSAILSTNSGHSFRHPFMQTVNVISLCSSKVPLVVDSDDSLRESIHAVVAVGLRG